MREYYNVIFKKLAEGKTRDQIEDDLSRETHFAFLTKIPAFNSSRGG
jgi:hypothetical protein